MNQNEKPVNGVKITKKNQDGSYDYSETMFDAVDAYSGDHVYRTIELAPAIPGKQPKYVKFSLNTFKDNSLYTMKPIKENSYQVASEYYKGFSFYLESASGVKFMPDKNGIISITNILTTPLNVTLHMIVEQYAVQDIEQKTFLDDVSIRVWSK